MVIDRDGRIEEDSLKVVQSIPTLNEPLSMLYDAGISLRAMPRIVAVCVALEIPFRFRLR